MSITNATSSLLYILLHAQGLTPTTKQAVKQIGNTLRKSVELLLSHLQSEDCIERPL